ncbi:hypothetical protein VPFG_00249 [Vibrio phage nt-1]|uniref:Uncharacterized protein n=1 Tax=Vibrio phage nt-1 TaxID=115992 RepID=R9TGL9_9CAUD|nr:hypothetical protein VPFG_00249 [Vibrio phage nt-1]AGN30248.1 hypothetical protein VPFG_00249 [Vibrio phage nt-1]
MKIDEFIATPYVRSRLSMVDKYGDVVVTCSSEWHMDHVERVLLENAKLKEALGNTLTHIDQVENSMMRMGVDEVVHEDLPRDLPEWDFQEYVQLSK